MDLRIQYWFRAECSWKSFVLKTPAFVNPDQAYDERYLPPLLYKVPWGISDTSWLQRAHLVGTPTSSLKELIFEKGQPFVARERDALGLDSHCLRGPKVGAWELIDVDRFQVRYDVRQL